MNVQAIANINVDFYDTKYISINAKQLDKKTRFLSVTCYSHGELCPLNSGEHSAYIRYKKADGYSVFNFCDINPKGKILVELTEQMLAIVGIGYADLVVVNKGSAVVDENTGEIVVVDNSGILSTMPFHVDVIETAFENSVVESSYEYDGLNDLLERAEADYSQVIRLSKSYAIGGTGERANENTDNAKYYSEQSKKSATNSETYMNAASNSASASQQSAINANTSAQNSQTYMGQSKTYMENAKTSESNAKTSENNAKASENNALNSEKKAQEHMEDALEYKNTAYDYSIVAQRYAVGGTNTVSGEDTDNSKYYYELSLESANNAGESEANALNSANAASDSESNAFNSANAASNSETNALMSATNASDSATSAHNSAVAAEEYANITQNNMNSAINSASSASASATSALESETGAQNYYLQTEAIVNGLNGAFLPKGTIAYAELAVLKENDVVAAGYLYNISDNFVTDDTFRMGAGIEYEAGTNVYYTADGQWDCLAGTTVTGVKGVNETIYRKGNVELTAENVGAVSVANIATVDEIKSYLGIV